MPKINYERVRAVRAKREAGFTADPKSAQTTKSVTVRLIDSFHKAGEVRGFTVESDELEAAGGENLAPNPTEVMLMSLGFCQMSILVAYSASMRIDIDDVKITVTGHRDTRGLQGLADVRPGYYEIEMATRIESGETVERLERLVRTAEERCPVYDNLVNPTLVTNRATRGADILLESSSTGS